MTTPAARLAPLVRVELDAASAAEQRGDADAAFHHLERAHVLGQPFTGWHVRVHGRMLRWGWRQRRVGEVVGQLWRVVAAALFTPAGFVPRGNTGGANVSGLRPMPIPADLQRAIDAARSDTPGQGGTLRLSASSVLIVAAVFASVACGTPPTGLDLSLDKPTTRGTYRVTLLPPSQMPAINQLHSWQVRVTTADGTPLRDARFVVGGGMPQHGHGWPTRPRVTRDLGDGTYLIEGLKFSMTGWWELKLDVSGAPGEDRVTFNTVYALPALRP